MSAARGGEGRRAVVTGGNRGLGLETVRALARLGYSVVLASRDPKHGEEMAASLRREHDVRALALDVTDDASVRAFAEEVGAQGPVDSLVNNAGASFDGFDETVARRTLDTNFLGALRVTDALRPRLSRGANVVMVSSGMGILGTGYSSRVREEFRDPKLDRPRLIALTNEFVQRVALGDEAKSGWPSNAYSVSKAAMNALARVLAHELGPQGVRVNAVDPGWVRTRMGGRGAPRSLEEGASGIVWAATLGERAPTGGFFRDGVAIAL